MTVVAFVNVLLLGSIPYLVWRNVGGSLRPFFWPAYIVKLSAGICLGLIYSKYYGEGDTLVYFEDASWVAKVAGSGVAEYISFLWNGLHPDLSHLNEAPRALFFTKLASLIVLLSGFNYWIASCWFSLVSFLAAWLLVNEIARLKQHFGSAAVFAFLFFPSIVFWTSGLIKESVAMTCLYLLVVAFLRVWSQRAIGSWLAVLLPLLIWLLWALKYYWLVVLAPVLFTELAMERIVRPRMKSPSSVAGVTVWLVIFLVPAFIVTLAHPNFYPERFLEVIVSNHNTFVAISDPRDVMWFPELTAEPMVILQQFPRAVTGAIFRPFIWEATNPLQAVAGIENLFLLILMAGTIFKWVRSRRVYGLTGPLLLYCLLLSAFLALSTPNYGTLSRYRVGFLPFLALVIGCRNPLASVVDRFASRTGKPLGA